MEWPKILTNMTKIVYNNCFGGFGLSTKAVMRYAKLKGIKLFEDTGIWGSSFYTVPVDEYRKLEEEAKQIKNWDKLKGLYFGVDDIDRRDPMLVQVVEELGREANGFCAKLAIAEIPEGTPYRIDEYDGNETVRTHDSYDWKIA